jgi:hypothetical protein
MLYEVPDTETILMGQPEEILKRFGHAIINQNCE